MPQCHATNKSGNQCKKGAILGGVVCGQHGGRAPQVKAAAARRLAQANLEGQIGQLLDELRDTPMPPLIDGLEAAVDHCARMVVVTKFVASSYDVLGVNRFGESVVHPAVTEYGNWVDRYARATKLALDAGIDERRTRLSEADASRVFAAIDKGLVALGLTDVQRAEFGRVVGGELRALDAA